MGSGFPSKFSFEFHSNFALKIHVRVEYIVTASAAFFSFEEL